MNEFKNPEARPCLLKLPKPIRDLLAEDGLNRYPQEACGALFGSLEQEVVQVNGYAPLSNIAANPLHAFVFDPAEWVRCCYNSDLVGIFHTHPTSPPCPSLSDMEGLQYFGSLLSLYLIGSSIPEGNGSVQTKEPPGSPDGLYLNAYSVARRSNGSYFLENLIMSY